MNPVIGRILDKMHQYRAYCATHPLAQHTFHRASRPPGFHSLEKHESRTHSTPAARADTVDLDSSCLTMNAVVAAYGGTYGAHRAPCNTRIAYVPAGNTTSRSPACQARRDSSWPFTNRFSQASILRRSNESLAATRGDSSLRGSALLGRCQGFCRARPPSPRNGLPASSRSRRASASAANTNSSTRAANCSSDSSRQIAGRANRNMTVSGIGPLSRNSTDGRSISHSAPLTSCGLVLTPGQVAPSRTRPAATGFARQ